MIPVHLKRPKGQPSPRSTHYVVARNGLFLAKREWWVEAVVPVKRIKVLDSQAVSARLLMPKLPAEVFGRALKALHQVYEILQSESCVLVHYCKETGYELSMPPQEVNATHIKYNAKERLPGHLPVGAIHPHGTLPAFHSSVDCHDQCWWDGIHITVGHLGLYPEFSLAAQMVVTGHRFPVDATWFEGLQGPTECGFYQLECPANDAWEVPHEWLKNVHYAE